MKTKTEQVERRYKWRGSSINSFGKSSAQEVGEFIENCKDKSPEGILREVKRNPKCALYKLIEWDKGKAAELYQINTIRVIVNQLAVEVIRIGDSKTVEMDVDISAFQIMKNPATEKREYKAMEDIMNNDVEREIIIRRARSELKIWTVRYAGYQELSKIAQTVRKLLKDGD